MAFIVDNTAERYSEDKMLITMGIESYYGAPLKTDNEEIIGIMAVMDTKFLSVETALKTVLGLFSNKVAFELQGRL